MLEIVTFIAVGLAAGVFSGLFGLGGGVLIIPMLIYLLHFTQKQAQGTTMAFLVLPVGLLGAMEYYRQGYVNTRVALIITIGFFFGAFFGAKLAMVAPTYVLKKAFSVIMVIVAVRMFFSK